MQLGVIAEGAARKGAPGRASGGHGPLPRSSSTGGNFGSSPKPIVGGARRLARRGGDVLLSLPPLAALKGSRRRFALAQVEATARAHTVAGEEPPSRLSRVSSSLRRE